MRLWKDFDGEPFLVNPQLITVANPRRRKSKMRLRRNRKGQFLPRGHSVNPRRRRRRGRKRSRRNMGNPVMARNPRRRRRHAVATRHRRRRARRNPPSFRGLNLLGFTFPSIQTIAWTGAGFLAPSFAEGMARRYLPTELYSTALGRYIVKIGSVLGISWLAGQFAGSEARNKVMLGGSVYIVANLVADYVPQLTAGTSAPAPSGASRYMPVGHQAMIGRYQSVGSYMTTGGVPERLRPENRY